MAIRYVSNSADNGYQVGADSGTAATKAAPWITLDYAIANATAADQIIVNGGAAPAFILLPAGGVNVYTAATFFNIGKALRITGDNFPTYKRAGAQTRVININTTSDVVLEDFILDGESTASLSGLTISTQVSKFAVTVTGVKTINCPIYGINSSALLLDLTVRRCNLQGVRGGLKTAAQTAGLVTVTDNDVTASGLIANEGAIFIDGSGATGVRVNVSDNRVAGVTAQSTTAGIRIMNCRGKLQRNRIKVSGTQSTAAGVHIGSKAAVLAEKFVCRWNYVEHSNFNGASAGWLYLFGSDGDGADTANDNQINRLVAYGNAGMGVYGSSAPLLHGMEYGHVVGGNAFNNILMGVGIGILAKRTTGDLYLTNNTMPKPLVSTSGLIRCKGAQNVIAVGNMVSIDGNSQNYAIVNDSEPTVPAQDSLNNSFIGNTISAPWLATRVVSSAASSTAEFMMNDYDLPLGVSGASPFSYNGVNYVSIAAWAAAQEPTLQQLPVGQEDREFWNKLGMRPGGRGVLPPSGVMPAWGA